MDDDDLKFDGLDDLESLLGGSDGDSDPFAGFDFGEDGDDDPFASLQGFGEQLNELSPSPMSASSGDSDELDLDKQLEMLLMADQSADETFEVKDVSTTITQTVYDPAVDGMGSVQYVKGAFIKEEERKAKLFADISAGKMIATLIIGVLAIGVGFVTFLVTNRAIQAQETLIAAVSHFTPIEIPRGEANNASHIFINERAYLFSDPFTLTRMTAAYSGTFFYFEESFNPDDYYILLFNQARKLYQRTTFDIVAAPNDGTVLKFEPLSGNTLFLTLHIQCKNTNEFIRFYYRFTSQPIHEAPVFINQPHHVMGENSGLIVRHAVFDSASSKIHFSFAPDLQAPGLRINSRAEAPFVSLTDINFEYAQLTNEHAEIFFDEFNMLIGAATFAPIQNLESNIEVVFNDMVYHYPNPYVGVTPAQLFGNSQRNPLPVQIGGFTLNLEGIIQDNNLIKMTLHGLNENNRRTATNLDIALRVALDDGSYVYMPGDVGVSPRGSDVKFDMRPYGSQLRNAHISQYSFVINWVEFDVETISAPIRVTQFFNMKSTRRHAAETAVTEAFIGFLSYKSGEVTRDGIVGISPEVKRSGVFDIFAPVECEGRPMYAVSISAGDMISNYDYVGVVEVTWAADENENLKYFREVFQITAQSENGIWTIVNVAGL
jgi:hypothetical protein